MRRDQFAESRTATPAEQRLSGRQIAEPTHAAMLALQRTAGNRAVARWVGQRASSSGWKYYSSFEPQTLYDTEAEAQTADRRLEPNASASQSWSETLRYFTLYAYTHTNPRNALGLATQGPHSVAHVNVSDALARRQTPEELRAAFEQQVPDPKTFEQLLREERGGGGKQLEMNYERAIGDYGRMYETAKRALTSPSVALDYARSLLAALMNLNPYATYNWKTSSPSSQTASAGKGEDRTRFNVDDRARWTRPDVAQEFVERRRSFWQHGRDPEISEPETSRTRPRRRSFAEPTAAQEATSASSNLGFALALIIFVVGLFVWMTLGRRA